MSDGLECPWCPEEMAYNGRSYDCKNCSTRWVPHNLTTMQDIAELEQEMIEQRQEYRQKQAEKREQSWWYRVRDWFR